MLIHEVLVLWASYVRARNHWYLASLNELASDPLLPMPEAERPQPLPRRMPSSRPPRGLVSWPPLATT